MESDSICPTCKKRISDDRETASLTQWIFNQEYCTCRRHSSHSKLEITTEQASVKHDLPICGNCNRTIGATDGSLTQWIFQAHSCNCPTPHPIHGQLQYLDPESLPGWDRDIERYLPLRCLGEGAGGSVFLCRDAVLDRPVAVKIARQMTEHRIVSFQNEARALSRLENPYTVRVLDFGVTAKGVPFVVMDYVDGENLATWLESGNRLDEPNAVRLVRRLCQALDQAHQASVPHRDLKPDNIIIIPGDGTDPEPVLIDFGLAETGFNGDGIRQDSAIIGSASYMPPETVRESLYDEISEVYSLGCILFEVLTGKVAFLGESMVETLGMHENPAPGLTEACPESTFSPEMETVVARAMEPDRAKRYQTPGELADAMRDICLTSSEPLQPSASGTKQGPGEKTAGIILIASAILLFGCIAGLSALLLSPDSRESAAGEGSLEKPKRPGTSLKELSDAIIKTDEKATNAAAPEFSEQAEPRALVRTARELQAAGRHPQAAELYRRALAICDGKNGNRIVILAGLGDALYKSGDMDGALDCFARATSSRAESSEEVTAQVLAWRVRARIHRLHEEPEKALSDMNRVLETGGTDGAYQERADIYKSLGRYEEAVEDLTEAIRRRRDDPDSGHFYFERASLYRLMGNEEAARKDLEKGKSISAL